MWMCSAALRPSRTAFLCRNASSQTGSHPGVPRCVGELPAGLVREVGGFFGQFLARANANRHRHQRAVQVEILLACARTHAAHLPAAPGHLHQVGVEVQLDAFVLQALLYTLSIFFAWPWSRYATFPTALCALILAAICIEADSTPYTSGANDNASAVGLVLALSEHFSARPLQNTRLFMVCTGCEEVQHYGMIDFYRRHRAELKQPKALVFEMLGCAGPAWMTKEGIIVPFKPDSGLLKAAEDLAREHPEWGAYPVSISGGNTEMADAVRNKIPAITLMGMTREGVSPYWHQQADTFDKMDAEVMERAWGFVNGFIGKIVF